MTPFRLGAGTSPLLHLGRGRSSFLFEGTDQSSFLILMFRNQTGSLWSCRTM